MKCMRMVVTVSLSALLLYQHYVTYMCMYAGTTVQPITLPLFMFSSGLLLTNSTNYTIAAGNATLTRSAASGRRLMANPDALPVFNILDRFCAALMSPSL